MFRLNDMKENILTRFNMTRIECENAKVFLSINIKQSLKAKKELLSVRKFFSSKLASRDLERFFSVLILYIPVNNRFRKFVVST